MPLLEWYLKMQVANPRHFRQADLADIFGGQANVSKFLNGERPLSKSQMIGLKNKFNISGDSF